MARRRTCTPSAPHDCAVPWCSAGRAEALLISQQTRLVLMATFVLIPGAGGAAWYWHRVLPLLQQAGHEALAVDLPGDDAHAGLHTYADLVVALMGKRNDVV